MKTDKNTTDFLGVMGQNLENTTIQWKKIISQKGVLEK